MKKEKAKAGLILCSVVTASAAGLSQTASAAATSFFSTLGQKIKDGAKAAAEGIWEKSKEVISTNEVVKNCALAATFILPVKYLPKSTWKFIGDVGAKVLSTAYSTLKSSSVWGALIIGATAIAAVRKVYNNWEKEKVEKAIKEKEERNKKVLGQVLEEKKFLDNFRQNSDAPPPPGRYNTGGNKIYINNNSVGLDYPAYKELMQGRRNLTYDQNNNNHQ